MTTFVITNNSTNETLEIGGQDIAPGDDYDFSASIATVVKDVNLRIALLFAIATIMINDAPVGGMYAIDVCRDIAAGYITT